MVEDSEGTIALITDDDDGGTIIQTESEENTRDSAMTNTKGIFLRKLTTFKPVQVDFDYCVEDVVGLPLKHRLRSATLKSSWNTPPATLFRFDSDGSDEWFCDYEDTPQRGGQPKKRSSESNNNSKFCDATKSTSKKKKKKKGDERDNGEKEQASQKTRHRSNISETKSAPEKTRRRGSNAATITKTPLKRKPVQPKKYTLSAPRPPVKKRVTRQGSECQPEKDSGNSKERKIKGCRKMMVFGLVSATEIRRLRILSTASRVKKLTRSTADAGTDDAEATNAADDDDDREIRELALENEIAMEIWRKERSKFDEIFPPKKNRQNLSKPKENGEKHAKSGKKTSNDVLVTQNGHSDGDEAQCFIISVSSSSSGTTSKKKPLFRLVGDVKETCKFCEHTCGRSTPLKVHLERHHSNRCDTCVKEFGDLAALRKHRKNVHTTRHVCDLCDKSFVYEAAYKRHLGSKLHTQIVNGQVKLYNKVVKYLNLSEVGGARPIEDNDVPCFRSVKEEMVQAAKVRQVKVYEGEVVEFLMGQPIFNTTDSQTPAAINGASSNSHDFTNAHSMSNDNQNTASPHYSGPILTDSFVPPVQTAPQPSGPVQIVTPVSAQSTTTTSALASAPPTVRVQAPSGEDLRAVRREALNQGKRVAIEQLMQAMNSAPEDIQEQLYSMDIFPRPSPVLEEPISMAQVNEPEMHSSEVSPPMEIVPIPPSTLTMEELQDLEQHERSVILLDSIPSSNAAIVDNSDFQPDPEPHFEVPTDTAAVDAFINDLFRTNDGLDEYFGFGTP